MKQYFKRIEIREQWDAATEIHFITGNDIPGDANDHAGTVEEILQYVKDNYNYDELFVLGKPNSIGRMIRLYESKY